MSTSPPNSTSYKSSTYETITSRKRTRQSSEQASLYDIVAAVDQYHDNSNNNNNNNNLPATNESTYMDHNEHNNNDNDNDDDYDDQPDDDYYTTTTNNTNTNSPTQPPPPSTSEALDEYLSSEISNLKTELEQSQSQRRIDRIRSENKISRLQRHVTSLEQDSEEAHNLVEEIQVRSEEGLEKMNASRRAAVGKVQELERRLASGGGGVGGRREAEVEGLVEENALLRRKYEMVERRMGGMEGEMERLRTALQEAEVRLIAADVTTAAMEQDPQSPQRPKTPSTNSPPPPQLLSPAQPSILKELNKTRLQLSETQRTNRSLTRRNNDAQTKLTQLTHYKESNRRAEAKVHVLETELTKVRREREILKVVEVRWKEFRGELLLAVPSASATIIEEEEDKTDDQQPEPLLRSGDENAPPEIASVLRHIRTLTHQLTTLQNNHTQLNSHNAASQRRIKLLEETSLKNSKEADTWRGVRKGLEANVRDLELDCATVKAQEGVWKREAGGMRSLLDTYREREDIIFDNKSNTAGGSMSNKKRRSNEPHMHTKNEHNNSHLPPLEDPTISGLILSLTSAQSEIKILTERLSTTTQTLTTELETSQEEVTRVTTKFGKIREALMGERAKAEAAEDKAVRAETLVGKGAFNEGCTRVLHLKENPLMEAVRGKYEQEIEGLRDALETREKELATALNGNGGGHSATPTNVARSSTLTPTTTTTLDAQKLHKRLKESFREKIGLFREGVYLITGYKIDMIADGTCRPQFKVRSMYAEREEDHLMFRWPIDWNGGGSDGDEVVNSLDILGTDMAQTLAKGDSFQYMTKFNSLPAFMASVCMTLFETQTTVGC